jgi:methyltransferase (TIGR00027 family)
MATNTDSAALSDVHRTAFLAAALRAEHFIKGAEPKIFSDEYALPLGEMSAEEVLTFTARVPPGSASSCVVRSRFTEDRLAAARGRLNQYVVLGAGLDSYALRMGDQLGDMIVFEVDDPPFQNWKRARINALGLKTPTQVRYAPCDFETTSIAQALSAQGFDAGAPCFISWLGVTMYLTRDAIRETLRWAGARPAGSEIVLTITEPQAQTEYRGAARPMPFVSYIAMEEMVGMLRETGFTTIEPMSREQAQHAYFAQRTDGLVAPANQAIVAAIV